MKEPIRRQETEEQTINLSPLYEWNNTAVPTIYRHSHIHLLVIDLSTVYPAYSRGGAGVYLSWDKQLKKLTPMGN